MSESNNFYCPHCGTAADPTHTYCLSCNRNLHQAPGAKAKPNYMARYALWTIAILIVCGFAWNVMARISRTSETISETLGATPRSTQRPNESQPTTVSNPPPSPKTYSGSGDDVVEIDWPTTNAAIVTITHTGTSNFSVWTLDSRGENIDLLVNEIGGYSGTRPFNFTDDPAYFEVNSSGPWRLIIKPLSQAGRISSFPYSGQGDNVLIIDSEFTSGRVDISHQGESNFAVWTVDASGRQDLLVNDIGAYSGTVLFRDAFILNIRADGPWAIDEAD